MYVHLIKWLSEIINKEGGVLHMLAPGRRCLDCSKIYCDVTERWLLAWNQNKHVMYYIFHKLILKSVLVFSTFAPTSFEDDTDFIIARL